MNTAFARKDPPAPTEASLCRKKGYRVQWSELAAPCGYWSASPFAVLKSLTKMQMSGEIFYRANTRRETQWVSVFASTLQ